MLFLVNKLRPIGLYVLILSTITGCISSTRLNSSDPTATIISSSTGQSETGTLVYRDRKPFFGSVEIKIEKPGCKSAFYEISKRGDFSVESFLTGLYTFGFGWLWITNYLPEYHLNYNCEKISAPAKASK